MLCGWWGAIRSAWYDRTTMQLIHSCLYFTCKLHGSVLKRHCRRVCSTPCPLCMRCFSVMCFHKLHPPFLTSLADLFHVHWPERLKKLWACNAHASMGTCRVACPVHAGPCCRRCAMAWCWPLTARRWVSGWRTTRWAHMSTSCPCTEVRVWAARAAFSCACKCASMHSAQAEGPRRVWPAHQLKDSLFWVLLSFCTVLLLETKRGGLCPAYKALNASACTSTVMQVPFLLADSRLQLLQAYSWRQENGNMHNSVEERCRLDQQTAELGALMGSAGGSSSSCCCCPPSYGAVSAPGFSWGRRPPCS